MSFRTVGIFALLALAACDRSQPEPVALPQVRGAPYQVLLRTFHDGDYADQPFHLLVKTSAAEDPKILLRAEQCKNVSVAQAADKVYVFYDELMLAGFTSIKFDSREPTVLLCDNHASECIDARQRLERGGAKLSRVCTYSTP